MHVIQSRCCRHLLRYSPAHLPHSSVFAIIPDSRPGAAARVDSLCDCTLTDSTTLITVSSSHFINFLQAGRPAAEKNTSCVFCRVGGQTHCWMCWLDFLRLGVGSDTHTSTHTHARADPCVDVATVYCGNRWFSFITSRQFFFSFKTITSTI